MLESHSSDGRAGLDVRAGTRTVTLQGWPTDDWPAVPRVAAIDPIASIDASAAVDAFERVALCASDDEARPVLTCVALFFREDPPALEVVATDSYRLGVARMPLEAGFRVSDGPLLVPARADQAPGQAAQGSRRRRPGSGSGGIGRRAIARIARRVQPARCRVDGSNRRGGVPELEAGRAGARGRFVRVRSGRARFGPASRGTSVRSTKGAPVRLTLDRTCSLALKDPDLGEMREALTEARFSPNGAGAMEVAFNPDYLADAIRFCGAERGRMWVRDGLKPALFEGPDRRYVLMPIRLP